MNWFEKILASLDGRMTTPTTFGWFHILSLLIIVALIVLVCFTCRKLSDKKLNIILFTVALILILLEFYKQLNYSFDSTTGVWDYQWYIFPFQFCSTPMYIMLLASIVKKGKFKDILLSFLATFALFAGLVVMIYPGDIFTTNIGVNFQSIIHHSAMLVIGVLLFVSKNVKIEHKTLFKGIAVFGALLAMALVMNVIFHFTGIQETFNLFYISPYFPCTLPILSIIYAKVPYVIFLIIYIIGFSLAAYIMLLFAMLIKKINTKIQNRKLQKTNK